MFFNTDVHCETLQNQALRKTRLGSLLEGGVRPFFMHIPVFNSAGEMRLLKPIYKKLNYQVEDAKNIVLLSKYVIVYFAVSMLLRS